MEDDVSKKTVVVLLILTIIISVVGTLVVLEEAQKIRSVRTGQEQALQGLEEPNQVGSINLNILPRPSAELQGSTGGTQ